MRTAFKAKLSMDQDFNTSLKVLSTAFNMTVVEQDINFGTLYGKSIRSDDICLCETLA